ncbi:MAG: sugar transferase [Bacteroidales bacterium]
MLIKIFDLLFSFLLLIILFPFFIIISLAIVVDSKGGVFYLQNRVGFKGKEFKLYKFRTMYVDSDKEGLLTIGAKDMRITKVGIVLRKYKLDEIPQLLNVLIGNMSFVGPRPEVKKYVDFYSEEQRKILNVKPGITDCASIVYYKESEMLSNPVDPEKKYINEIMPKKIKLNMTFIDNYNFKTYFNILLKTFFKIIKSIGKN